MDITIKNQIIVPLNIDINMFYNANFYPHDFFYVVDKVWITYRKLSLLRGDDS